MKTTTTNANPKNSTIKSTNCRNANLSYRTRELTPSEVESRRTAYKLRKIREKRIKKAESILATVCTICSTSICIILCMLVYSLNLSWEIFWSLGFILMGITGFFGYFCFEYIRNEFIVY